MPMDQTDRKLINGSIAAVVLFGVVYFWPFDWPVTGYGKQLELPWNLVASSVSNLFRGDYIAGDMLLLGPPDNQGYDTDADDKMFKYVTGVYDVLEENGWLP